MVDETYVLAAQAASVAFRQSYEIVPEERGATRYSGYGRGQPRRCKDGHALPTARLADYGKRFTSADRPGDPRHGLRDSMPGMEGHTQFLEGQHGFATHGALRRDSVRLS
ncbi:hypothetical protein GCM10009858_02830 [Terrabacter carboxydivorans]|uniref:Uncharacterized protein n=1 Tax=Terrabacter carboxydivorans TaxID=619730 RepID=A0ABN3KSW3_9MICO